MEFSFTLLFGIVGTLAGLTVSGLGITALNHLSTATEADRTIGWSLWWWLDKKRYDSVGQRLCDRGAWAFSLGAVCWILAVYFWKH
ncbi:MAG: hypothetical protein V4627_04380 [Pseudomonadota bacterium]